MTWFKSLSPTVQVMVGGVIVIVAIMLAGLWLQIARKRWLAKAEQDVSSGGVGFSIDELDALHRAGQLSDEEFGKLRRRALHLDAGAGLPDNQLTDKDEPDDDKEDAPQG